jgi:hypothetical protein
VLRVLNFIHLSLFFGFSICKLKGVGWLTYCFLLPSASSWPRFPSTTILHIYLLEFSMLASCVEICQIWVSRCLMEASMFLWDSSQFFEIASIWLWVVFMYWVRTSSRFLFGCCWLVACGDWKLLFPHHEIFFMVWPPIIEIVKVRIPLLSGKSTQVRHLLIR